MRQLATAWAIGHRTGRDCYRFTAEVVFEVTGRDFRSLFTYRNAREGQRIIERAGGLLVLTRGVLGEPCEPSECDDGDPLLVRAGREMLGVKFQGTAVVRTRRGVAPLLLDFATHGWRL